MEQGGGAVQEPAQGPAGTPGVWRFSFFGRGGTLFGIYIVNLFFILITLGIYYFWGKARLRRYLWGQADFNGDRFSYHGTGKETLLGWMKAVLVFIVPIFLLQNLPILIGMPLLELATGLLSLILIYLFIPFAIVGTRRYRLSRTALRAIRFSFRGKWWAFARIFIGGILLTGLTLGLYYPYYKMRASSFLVSNTWFGNRRFEFTGQGRDLFGKYVVALILAIPTFYLSLVWFHYRRTVYTWGHTTFEKAAFRMEMTFGAFVLLYLANILILLFTLGFGFPWVVLRTVRFYFSRLRLEGELDLAGIVQESRDSTAVGEELGGFWDVGFDLG